MDDEYELVFVKRYSEGDEKTVDCETVDQFIILRFVRDTATDDVVSTLIVPAKGGKYDPPIFFALFFFL